MICDNCIHNETSDLNITFLRVKRDVFCSYANEKIKPPASCAAKVLTIDGWEKIYNSTSNEESKKIIYNRILELKSQI